MIYLTIAIKLPANLYLDYNHTKLGDFRQIFIYFCTFFKKIFNHL